MSRPARDGPARGAGQRPRAARQAPLDVLMLYHLRLQSCASALPYGRALEWVQRRDEDERKLWADRHRSSTLTLGKVVKELYERRELVWDATTAPAPASAQPASARGEAKPPRQDAGARWEIPKPADRQKDGKEVCRAWNNGKCSEPCPRGFLHVCNNVVGKGGRTCGMRNHTAADCRRKTFQQPAGAAAADKGARR